MADDDSWRTKYNLTTQATIYKHKSADSDFTGLE